MGSIRLRSVSLPLRCEICHQSDCFDASNNYCSRCAAVSQASKGQIRNWFLAVPGNFWLVLIMVVFPSLAIIVKYAPHLFHNKPKAAGAAAVETLRLYYSSQAAYQTELGNGNYATAAELFQYDLIGAEVAEASGVPAMRSQAGLVTKGNWHAKAAYRFLVTTRPATPERAATFKVYAIAAQKYDDWHNFYLDESGVIRISESTDEVPNADSRPLNN